MPTGRGLYSAGGSAIREDGDVAATEGWATERGIGGSGAAAGAVLDGDRFLDPSPPSAVRCFPDPSVLGGSGAAAGAVLDGDRFFDPSPRSAVSCFPDPPNRRFSMNSKRC